MSSDPSLELVAAQSQINQYRVYNTCNYILGSQWSECGGGEANPVNREQLGCWVILEASRVVNLLSHHKFHLEGRAWTSCEEMGFLRASVCTHTYTCVHISYNMEHFSLIDKADFLKNSNIENHLSWHCRQMLFSKN